MGESINAMGIAVIHTSFNLAATAAMLPFAAPHIIAAAIIAAKTQLIMPL